MAGRYDTLARSQSQKQLTAKSKQHMAKEFAWATGGEPRQLEGRAGGKKELPSRDIDHVTWQ